jgi:hypothetical protein
MQILLMGLIRASKYKEFKNISCAVSISGCFVYNKNQNTPKSIMPYSGKSNAYIKINLLYIQYILFRDKYAQKFTRQI